MIINKDCLEYTSRKGCNDLETKEIQIFRGFSVESNEEPYFRDVLYDFDIIHWLKNRLKESSETSNKQS